MLWLAVFVLLMQQSYALFVAPLMDLAIPLTQTGWLVWVLLGIAIWGLSVRD
ncbi:hypothetical protein [Synechococcus sp. RSCCF101]|uniref:hypothetical protein n=1 Tax=Synechococcus sp. RSCCF101 TaxID=2511069 RepID=UPI00177CCF41|nr:hypothetical protein [Synechococcus sp. RSCCF101]